MKTQLRNETVHFGTGSGSPAPDAPTIVFVHGAGHDATVWVMPARYFARHGLRVLAPDLPAHGRSSGEPLQSIEAMADWLAELVDQQCRAGVIMVGHSMGALVTMSFTQRHPQLVKKSALLGASAPMPVGPPLLNAAADSHHAAIDMANTWSHSTVGRLGASQMPGIHILNSGERLLERMSSGVYHADLAACNAFATPVTPAQVPTLVIAGEADQMTPAKAGVKVAHALGNSEVVILRGCGHAMLMEQPNEVLDTLADFILE